MKSSRDENRKVIAARGSQPISQGLVTLAHDWINDSHLGADFKF